MDGPLGVKTKVTETKRYPVTRWNLFWLPIRSAFLLVSAVSIGLTGLTLSVYYASGLGFTWQIPLAFACLCGVMLLSCALSTGKPMYRYLAGKNISLYGDLKGKYLTKWNDDLLYYEDAQWFIVVMPGFATAICASLIDFRAPVKRWTKRRPRMVRVFYRFEAKDGLKLDMLLDREISAFRQWVEAHGGRIAQ